MNKQELIKKYEDEFSSIGMNLSTAIKFKELWIDILELDEPQKVTVPKFVADYIKYAIENDWDFQDLFKCIEDEELLRWVYHERNQETLAAAWINGYTVEKEKRYIVAVKNIDKNCKYLKWNILQKYWYIGNGNNTVDLRLHHTKEKLQKGGFGDVFTNPLFEVEEVE